MDQASVTSVRASTLGHMTKPKYSREALVVAVAFTATMTDLLIAMEIPVTPGTRAAMWARLNNYGIDTSHWARSPRSRAGFTWSDDRLAMAVAASTSVAEVLRRLGIRPAGGSHFHISKRIREAGLDTSHFLGQAHFRGKPGERKAAAAILVVLPPDSTRPKRKMLARAMTEFGVPYVCACCGIAAEWRGKPLTLTIDHINGDWLDNRLENLRFLCPNCHAQTSTWCRQKSALRPPSIDAGP